MLFGFKKTVKEKYFGNRQTIKANVESLQRDMAVQLETLKKANQVLKGPKQPAQQMSNRLVRYTVSDR